MILEEIEQQFSEKSRYERGALSLEFIQGFSSQRQKFFQKWEADSQRKKETEPHISSLKGRSELYGCLLAAADAAEREAYSGERDGMTNALQMMRVFAVNPYENWEKLHGKLIPYLEKMRGRADYYQMLIQKIEMQFTQSERESKTPLDGSYLHGYYCMLQMLYRKTRFSFEPKTWTGGEDTRSALYGRLLGVSERIERKYQAGRKADTDERITNALRFMTSFARNPEETWQYLKVKLCPYRKYAESHGTKDFSVIEQIEERLRQHGWNTNIPLDSIYLHYYYNERTK